MASSLIRASFLTFLFFFISPLAFDRLKRCPFCCQAPAGANMVLIWSATWTNAFTSHDFLGAAVGSYMHGAWVEIPLAWDSQYITKISFNVNVILQPSALVVFVVFACLLVCVQKLTFTNPNVLQGQTAQFYVATLHPQQLWVVIIICSISNINS